MTNTNMVKQKPKRLNKKIVLAIVGLPAAGKTETTNFIVENFGFKKVYFGEITFEELKKRKLEINEVNERKVREELRKKYGMGVYALLNLKKIKKNFLQGCVIVESLYSWQEYLTLKKEFKENFKVMAIYASPQIRYQRLTDRPERPLDFEKAIKRDYAHIQNLEVGGPIALADVTIINQGNIKELHHKIRKAINRLLRE